MKTFNLEREHVFSNLMIKIVACTLLLVSFSLELQAQSVSVWLTNDGQRMQQQGDINLSGNTVSNPTISINENAARQTIDGFGFMLNQGSAKLIRQMTTADQDRLLRELFDPNSGISNAVVRISIAASDLSDSVYFYNDTPGDTNMNNFSLDGPDRRDLFPILRKIVALNPSIKILATPWSAPSWMKNNNDSKGGELRRDFHAAYALYFVKYIQAMQAEGFNIWAITPQNEPLNPTNQPSMFMSANQQLDFINDELGPQFERANITTKIIGYDHNLDDLNYPKTVASSRFVDGSAFHAYDNSGPGGGPNIPGMSEVQRDTQKNVYFTEQFTGSNGSFDGDFGWHMENIVIGSTRNWSKTVIEWNLVSDSNPADGPKTEGDGGCTTCLGAFTIDNGNLLSRNVSYYIIAQISKFVKPGARRLESNDGNLLNVAFRNPDGSRVLLVYNRNGGDQNIRVNSGSSSFTYNVPRRTAITFVWSGNSNPTRPNPPTDLTASAGDQQIRLQWNASSGATSYVIRRALPGGTYSTIKTGITGTSYTNTGLTNGQRYWYVVRARNAAGTSNSSEAVSAVPQAASTDIVSGSVYEIRNRTSGKVIDVSGISTRNGAQIQQWESTGGDNQQWSVENTGNGQYKLTAIHSGKVLDVVDGSISRGAKIQQWDDFGSSNQRWKIESAGGGYYRIISVKSNLALDVPGGSTENGAQLMQWTAHGRENQQWSFRLIANKSPNNQTSSVNSEKIWLSSNPTNGSDFTVYFSSSVVEQSAKISILDITGRVLHQFTPDILDKNQQEVLLDPYVNNLQTGRYFIKINELSTSFLKM